MSVIWFPSVLVDLASITDGRVEVADFDPAGVEGNAQARRIWRPETILGLEGACYGRGMARQFFSIRAGLSAKARWSSM